MYQVLFVDDDQAILEGLGYIIDWASYNINVCGHAYDGVDGIRKIEALVPDILVTDIRMPGLSGLEMIEHLLYKFPRMKIIILSGYDDFSYAQKAIELGVFSYILKPVKRADLRQKIEELTAVLDKEKAGFREKQLMTTRLSTLSKIARDKYFGDLVMTKNPADFARKIDFALLALEEWPDAYSLLLIELDFGKAEESLDLAEERVLAALDKGPQLFSLDFKHWVILNHSSSIREMESSNLNLLSILKKLLHFPYYCGISLVHSDVRDLPLAFDEAKEAMGEVFSAGQAKSFKDLRMDRQAVPVNCSSYIDGIMKAVKEIDEEEALQGLDKLFKYLVAQECRTSQFYTESINFLISLKKITTLLGLNYSPTRRPEYLNITYLQSQYRTLSGLKGFLSGILKETMEQIRERPVGASNLLIDQIKEYIRDHRTSENRESLADHFHITPTYLSRLFKNVTGMNLIDYLTQQKMEEAKTKLLYSSDQIQEIADYLGYSNGHYFTRVFEKYTGISPSRYRKIKGENK